MVELGDLTERRGREVRDVGRAEGFNRWITERVYWICGTTRRRLTVVVGFTVAAIVLSLLLAPKAEYLPTGNQNFLFGAVQTPPGRKRRLT